jgi:hypothetical protein
MQAKNESPNAITKLLPRETTIRIGSIDHDFTVGKLSLSVDAWLSQEFGSREIAAGLLEKGDPEALMKLLFQLFSNEDKIFLRNLKVADAIDEDGNEVVVTNLVKKLLIKCNTSDIKEIFIALARARGLALPEAFDNEGKTKAPSKKK